MTATLELETIVGELTDSKTFFDRSTSIFTEEHAGFRSTPDSFSVAEQIAHAAHTVDWFVEGAFGEGFDMNFEEHAIEVKQIVTLAQAREWFDRAFESAVSTVQLKSIDELFESMPDGPIMGGAPRHAIVSAIVDHTAHHRGALTVYARLCDLIPPMPYM